LRLAKVANSLIAGSGGRRLNGCVFADPDRKMDSDPLCESDREEAAHRWDWDEEMSLDIPTIDADHRDLALRYNGMVHALFQNGDPALFEKCFRGLVSRVRRHFAYEQRIMTDLGYKAGPAHAAQHEKLLREAEELTQRVMTGVEAYDCSVLVRYVKCWLIEHIVHEDRKLARFLHDCRPE
jgi:hemerythrin